MLKNKTKKQLVKLSEYIEFCSLKFYVDEFVLLDCDSNHIITFYKESQFLEWSKKYIEIQQELEAHLNIDYDEEEETNFVMFC